MKRISSPILDIVDKVDTTTLQIMNGHIHKSPDQTENNNTKLSPNTYYIFIIQIRISDIDIICIVKKKDY